MASSKVSDGVLLSTVNIVGTKRPYFMLEEWNFLYYYRIFHFFFGFIKACVDCLKLFLVWAGGGESGDYYAVSFVAIGLEMIKLWLWV